MPDLEIVVSSPESGRDYGASLTPIARYRSLQVLFGYDAQIAAFRAVADACSVNCWFAPFPQLFSGAAPPNRSAALTHVRFGPVTQARVLKGLSNVFISAEDPETAPLNIGRHPFGDGLRLPASMSRVYSLGPRRLALTGPGADQAVEWRKLPEAFVTQDLVALPPPLSASAGQEEVLEEVCARGLDLRSAAELAGGTTPVDGISFVPSLDLLTLSFEGQARLVMLPWNVSHPGSAIPGMLESLSETAGLDGAPLPVVMPYNYGVDDSDKVSCLMGGLVMRSRRRNVLRNVFVGRTAQLGAVAGLPALFDSAWLDVSDPEHAWVDRRLRALGVPAIEFGATPDGSGLLPESIDRSVREDKLGSRLVTIPRFNLRTFAYAMRLMGGRDGAPVSSRVVGDLESASRLVRQLAAAA